MSGTSDEEIHVHKASDAAVLGGVLAGIASAAMLALIFYVLWRTRKTKTSLPITVTRTSTLMRQSNSTQTNYDGGNQRPTMGRSATMSSTKLSTPPTSLPVSPGRTTPIFASPTTTIMDGRV